MLLVLFCLPLQLSPLFQYNSSSWAAEVTINFINPSIFLFYQSNIENESVTDSPAGRGDKISDYNSINNVEIYTSSSDR